jgi:hypothetical protein
MAAAAATEPELGSLDEGVERSASGAESEGEISGDPSHNEASRRLSDR